MYIFVRYNRQENMHLKILTFLFVIISLSTICKAQAPIIGPDYQEKAAGLELLKASRHFYSVAIFVSGGTIISFAGAIGGGRVLGTIGGLCIITGFVYMIESYSHVGKAGKILMDQHKLNLGATNSGFGMSYRF